MEIKEVLSIIDNLYKENDDGRDAKDLDKYEPEDLDEVAEDYFKEGYLTALATIKKQIESK